MEQKRDFIETFTGQKVWLPNCDPASIQIEDIAHALAFIPRFAGHINEFYSVAEHSLNVAEIVVKSPLKKQALLHDATEAYICDIPTPFKVLMPQYKALEEDLWRAVCERFNIQFNLHPDVKFADRIALMTERDVLKPGGLRWNDEYESTPRWGNFKLRRTRFGLKRASPNYIKNLFIEKFYEYQ